RPWLDPDTLSLQAENSNLLSWQSDSEVTRKMEEPDGGVGLQARSRPPGRPSRAPDIRPGGPVRTRTFEGQQFGPGFVEHPDSGARSLRIGRLSFDYPVQSKIAVIRLLSHSPAAFTLVDTDSTSPVTTAPGTQGMPLPGLQIGTP